MYYIEQNYVYVLHNNMYNKISTLVKVVKSLQVFLSNQIICFSKFTRHEQILQGFFTEADHKIYKSPSHTQKSELGYDKTEKSAFFISMGDLRTHGIFSVKCQVSKYFKLSWPLLNIFLSVL
jgi:hypothetical protein